MAKRPRETNRKRMDGRSTDGRRTDGKRTKKKRCKLCADKIKYIDYKDVSLLRTFIKSDSGKIHTRRTTGNCAHHQRQITGAIKRARNIALLPFTTKNK